MNFRGPGPGNFSSFTTNTTPKLLIQTRIF